MKILYVTGRIPFPPYKGDQLIAYEQLKRIGKTHEIYLVCFVNSEEDKDVTEKEFGKICKEIYFIQESKFKLLRVLKSIVNLLPLQVNLYTSRSNKKRLKKLVDTINPDVIHIQTIRLAELFIDVDVPKVIDMIDAMSLNMKRRAKNDSIILKPIFHLESKLLERYEEKVLKIYDQTILVSEKDKAGLTDPYNIKINPNGTFINEKVLEKYQGIEKENALIFHGNMQYYPNVEAVLHFAETIWPRIVRKNPDYKFYIVGKDPVNKIMKLHGIRNIVVTGFVEDICEYLCRSSIGIYPLTSGTGMQNKILEALACGLPSVVTPLAIQGFSKLTTNEVLLANNRNEIIEGIEMLIESQEMKEHYGLCGQQFVFKNYSWEKNVTTLERIWNIAIRKNVTRKQDSRLKESV